MSSWTSTRRLFLIFFYIFSSLYPVEHVVRLKGSGSEYSAKEVYRIIVVLGHIADCSIRDGMKIVNSQTLLRYIKNSCSPSFFRHYALRATTDHDFICSIGLDPDERLVKDVVASAIILQRASVFYKVISPVAEDFWDELSSCGGLRRMLDEDDSFRALYRLRQIS